MERKEIYQVIDGLLDTYCNDCFLHRHFKKFYSKTYAHLFCIHHCTIGAKIQEQGKKLLNQPPS